MNKNIEENKNPLLPAPPQKQGMTVQLGLERVFSFDWRDVSTPPKKHARKTLPILRKRTGDPR